MSHLYSAVENTAWPYTHLLSLGTDVTETFEDVGHSDEAWVGVCILTSFTFLSHTNFQGFKILFVYRTSKSTARRNHRLAI